MEPRWEPPWTTIATAELEDTELALRRRGDDFLIMIEDRVLMTSVSRSSEQALARLGLAPLAGVAAPRVLIGGLGMGFTVRAALEVLPPTAEVRVVELNRVVVDWCEGPLGPATNHAVGDPRVVLELADVAEVIARAAAGRFDAILLDLYEGPNDATQGRTDPFYSDAALARQRAALAPGGVLAVWSEDDDATYARRLASAGFVVATHAIASGDTQHVVYVGRVMGA